jgi:hypothetical protein
MSRVVDVKRRRKGRKTKDTPASFVASVKYDFIHQHETDCKNCCWKNTQTGFAQFVIGLPKFVIISRVRWKKPE